MPTENTTGAAGIKPLTDPADVLRLLGRYLASLVLLVATLVHIFQGNVVGAAFAGIASLVLLWTTFLLWRRLRAERMAAKAARDTASRCSAGDGIP
jgi:hypothetical protein